MIFTSITTRTTYLCRHCKARLDSPQSHMTHTWLAHRRFMDGIPAGHTINCIERVP